MKAQAHECQQGHSRKLLRSRAKANGHRLKQKKSTTRDNIIYLTIATGIVGLVGIIAWYQDSQGIPIHMPISDTAAGFFITTAVMFGYTVQYFRKLWTGVRFWLVLSVIMVIYLPLQWRLVQATGFTIGRVSVITFVELLCILFVVREASSSC